MKFTNQKSFGKKILNDVLSIGSVAKSEKELDKTVINATLGMLYDEDNNLYKFKTVEKVSSLLNDNQKYSYPPVSGSNEFKEVIKNWVFKKDLKTNVSVISTPGGTGAISIAITNYAENCILLPNIMWGNYIQIASECGVSYETYDLFNLNDLKEKIQNHLLFYNKVFIVINDPLHNPTGYCMSRANYLDLIDFINSQTKTVILLHDIAYLDYYDKNYLHYYENLNENCLCLIAFSGSKTFSLYGLRIGALIGVNKNIETIQEFSDVCEYSCRSKWSCSSRLGMEIITKVLTSEKKVFENELNEARVLIEKRSKLLINLLDNNNITYFPFNCGFFILIKISNKLIPKLNLNKVYVIPFKEYIRIAICSITTEEIIKLVSILKEVNCEGI